MRISNLWDQSKVHLYSLKEGSCRCQDLGCTSRNHDQGVKEKKSEIISVFGTQFLRYHHVASCHLQHGYALAFVNSVTLLDVLCSAISPEPELNNRPEPYSD